VALADFSNMGFAEGAAVVVRATLPIILTFRQRRSGRSIVREGARRRRVGRFHLKMKTTWSNKRAAANSDATDRARRLSHLRALLPILILVVGLTLAFSIRHGLAGPFRVRDWTFQALGGRYGMEQFGYYLPQTERRVTATVLHFGPLGTATLSSTLRLGTVIASIFGAGWLTCRLWRRDFLASETR
jgi:hypothetical protein